MELHYIEVTLDMEKWRAVVDTAMALYSHVS
jgi:hypothetical protein